MGLSSDAAAWIAIGAGAAAAIALFLCFLCWRELRRVRAGQAVLLGGSKGDLVDFAVSLQGRIDDLHRAVDEVAAALTRVDRRVDESVSKTSIVRYDAYHDTGGHQSASIALLDSARSGVVLSAIQTITFHITEQPPFSTPTKIKVQAGPVPAEKTFSNNTATYPVIFSFGA